MLFPCDSLFMLPKIHFSPLDLPILSSQPRQNYTLFLQNSKGVLLGNVYSSAAKERIDFSYSVSIGSQLSSYRSTASIDSSINSDRYVCFHPMGEAKAEQCKLFRSVGSLVSGPRNRNNHVIYCFRRSLCATSNTFKLTEYSSY